MTRCYDVEVQARELAVPDAYEFTPVQHRDDRGVFLETYRFEALTEIRGTAPVWKQANTSVSAAGVVRGVHYALVPPGQSKYVSVPRGRVIDYVVDIRVGSPTFGGWDSVVLDDVDRRSVFLAEGLGHVVVVVEPDSVVSYLVSEVFAADREKALDAFDPDLSLDLPRDLDLARSPKDEAALRLGDAAAAGLLPDWDECRAYYSRLARGSS